LNPRELYDKTANNYQNRVPTRVKEGNICVALFENEESELAECKTSQIACHATKPTEKVTQYLTLAQPVPTVLKGLCFLNLTDIASKQTSTM
jgi:hypothetical protein